MDFLDLEVEVEGHGKVTVDISYGGVFYIICDARKLGLDINTCGVDALIEAGDQVYGECFFLLLSFIYVTNIFMQGKTIQRERAVL